MGYIFTATVDMQYNDTTVSSNVNVYQKILNGSPIPIAFIHDTLDCGDLRETTITFADDTLSFRNNYDLPLQIFSSIPFQNKTESDNLSLHTHLSFSSPSQFFLSHNSGCYPIHIELGKDGTFHKITVYKSFPTAKSDGLLYPVLAEIIRTLNRSNGFEYEIQVEEFSTLPFLMAVISLPFTTASIRM